MAGQPSGDLHISVITLMEIERGIERQRKINPQHAAILESWLAANISTLGNRILPITSATARRWGRMQILLQRNDDDLAIAATALEHGLTIVTRNVVHFDKTGASVLNPFDAS